MYWKQYRGFESHPVRQFLFQLLHVRGDAGRLTQAAAFASEGAAEFLNGGAGPRRARGQPAEWQLRKPTSSPRIPVNHRC